MHELQEQSISCPYCGETLSVLLDPAEAGQEYIEDCQVCCRPITFNILYSNESAAFDVSVRREDD